MSSNQLELFQTANEYEKQIFLNAKQMKEIAQNLYKDADHVFKSKPNDIEDYGILKIEVLIDQVRDKESPEPSSPKMFIWKFIPSITFTLNENIDVLLKQGESLDDSIGPKIIPKWANELFTNNSFSHGDFLQVTTQYFTLEIAIKFLTSSYMDEMNSKLIDKKLLIYFDSKLFSINNFKSGSIYELDIINKIGNLFTKLKNIQNENWYFIGQYDDFTKENDFLISLDANVSFLEQKKANNLSNAESLVRTYNNDFLFLNNSEFFYQRKFNTDTWDNNYIFPPEMLNNFKQLTKDLYKKNAEHDNGRYFYFYRKKSAGESFFRADVLLPNRDIQTKDLLELLMIAQDLKDEKK